MAEEAIKLFEGETNRNKSFLSYYMLPLEGGLFGFGLACFTNWTSRRPVFSGIQKHFITAGVCALLARQFDIYRDARLADRDAGLRHYIELHPEDFQMPTRKKYSEVLNPWVPVR